MPPITCTTTGSFPRLPEVWPFLDDRAHGKPVDQAKFEAAWADATAQVVAMQAQDGIDGGVSDGEQGLTSFMSTSDLTGFAGPPVPFIPADLAGGDVEWEGGAYFAETATSLLPSCSEAIYFNPEQTLTRLRIFGAALRAAGLPASAGVVTVTSVGLLAELGNSHYRDEAEFRDALARATSEKIGLILAAGHRVQIDAPELPMGYHVWHAGMETREYVERVVRPTVALINRSIGDRDPGLFRLHMCYGNIPSPHDHDLPLSVTLPELAALNVSELHLTLANPRHEWEWQVLGDGTLPEAMKAGVGVIDPHTTIIEHPRTVAERLIRLGRVLGPGRIIATSDCGAGTFAGWEVCPLPVWRKKIRAMAEGAAMASDALGSKT